MENNECIERMDIQDHCHCYGILILAKKRRAKDSYTNPFDGPTAFSGKTPTGRHSWFIYT